MPNIKAKNYHGEYVRRENVNKVLYESADEEGVKIPFTFGEAVSKEVEPDFALGNMKVEFEDGELVTKLTIVKPENLVPENIAKDIIVAGVRGEHVGGGDVENMPKLYAPTAISGLVVDADGRQYFTVTNPYTQNGAFPRKLQILQSTAGDDNIVVAEVELSATGYVSTVNVYATHYNRALPVHQPRARFAADGFVVSDSFMNSSVIWNIAAVVYELTGVSMSAQYDYAFSGDVLKFTLTPDAGYYLPKSVSIVGATYVYNPDTKTLNVTADTSITTEEVRIVVTAVDVPWLRVPVIKSFNYPVLQATCPENSEVMALSLNGVELAEYPSVFAATGTYSVSVFSGSYAFVLTSGYYVSQNKGVANSHALCRLNFVVKGGSVTVQLACINYAEANYDFGIISTVDGTLLRSNSVDTTNVLKSFKGASSSAVQYVSFVVPEGNHFVEIKYRKDSSANSNNDNFQFKVNSIAGAAANFSINVQEYENQLVYGENVFSLVAKAESWTDSDPVSVTRSISLSVAYNSRTLSVSGFVPAYVTGFALYIDNVLFETFQYDGSGTWSVDLMKYSMDDVALHSIYVAAMNGEMLLSQSNAIESYLKWYTISYYDDDGTLLLTEQVEHGDVPSYEPKKEGYAFIGWDVDPAAAMADASYHAQWIEYTTFNEASWETIATISNMGLARKVFKVGDTKETTFLDGTEMAFEILAFDHDDLADGSGKAGISFICKYVLFGDAYHNMHNVSNSIVNYNATSLYTSLNSGAIYNNIPEEIKAIVKPVNKKTGTTGYRNTTLFTSIDKFWIPSLTEMGVTAAFSYTAAGQGTRYPVYNVASSYTQLDVDVRRTSIDGVYRGYWLRSPANGGTYASFWNVSATLNGSYAQAGNTYPWQGSTMSSKPGVVFGFCV